jgi:Flp pilus assembly protein TadG
VTLEFIIAMPVLFTAFLAIFEFGILSLVVQDGTHAVQEAAREGAKVWGSTVPFDNNAGGNYDPTGNDDIADQIALVVDSLVGVMGMEVRQNGFSDNVAKANVLVVIERGGSTARRGDNTLTCNRTGSAPGTNEIVVTVCFPLVDGTAPSTAYGNPVPNWLKPLGFDLSAFRFEMSARAELD